MKYIDAEKLIAEIERRIEEINIECQKSRRPQYSLYGKINGLEQTLNLVRSLQQDHLPDVGKMVESEHIADVSKMIERPKSTCKTCGFYENNCPFIRGKLIPYPNNVCKDYIHSAMKEKEQQEIDFEVKFAEFLERKDAELGAKSWSEEDLRELALYFYYSRNDDKQQEVDLITEYDEQFDSDPVYGKLVNRYAGIAIARHFYELRRNARKED